VRSIGLVTVQDFGRPGHMHEAVPPGGALVPELLAAANRRVRNPDGAAAIEILGELILRAEIEMLVGTDAEAHLLRPGEEMTIASEPRRVAYLAVRGGVEASRVLDGCGTLLAAGMGVRFHSGDRISPAHAGEWAAPAPIVPFEDAEVIHVVAGPDPAAFASGALEMMTAAPYRLLPASDRVGTRLEGPRLPRSGEDRQESRPMVRGAIEVPGDGNPIVLGPEHPTTGGYPIVAVIAHADLGRFFAIRLDGTVRFSLLAANLLKRE
jgi:allophanate hydrolase subunit 2